MCGQPRRSDDATLIRPTAGRVYTSRFSIKLANPNNKMSTNYRSKSWAPIYDQFNQGRHQKELEFYRAELKQCASPVLEVACGNGMILLELRHEGFNVYGFDLSQEETSRAA